jgi:hypothetical protein
MDEPGKARKPERGSERIDRILLMKYNGFVYYCGDDIFF